MRDNSGERQISRRDVALWLLGKMPDSQIAQGTGYSRERIRQFREARNIAAVSEFSSYTGSPAVEKIYREARPLLGNMPDTVIAKRLGVSASSVDKARKALNIKPFSKCLPLSSAAIDDLGTMSDGAFSKKYKVSPRTAFSQRRKRGIPAFAPSRRKYNRPKTEAVLRYRHLFGVIPDHEIAEKAGCSSALVNSIRSRWGDLVDNTREA